MTVIIKGKERDIKLAEAIRESFVTEYNDDTKFQALLEQLGTNVVDKLVFRLSRTEKINLYKDYNQLKAIGQEVFETNRREVFAQACLVEDARTWINNKGKYQEIVFESLYKVFLKADQLKAFLNQS